MIKKYLLNASFLIIGSLLLPNLVLGLSEDKTEFTEINKDKNSRVNSEKKTSGSTTNQDKTDAKKEETEYKTPKSIRSSSYGAPAEITIDEPIAN